MPLVLTEGADQVCHDTSRPPHVEIVQFLLGVGLSPEAEISGLDISDGLVVEMRPDEIPEGEAYWDDGDKIAAMGPMTFMSSQRQVAGE